MATALWGFTIPRGVPVSMFYLDFTKALEDESTLNLQIYKRLMYIYYKILNIETFV